MAETEKAQKTKQQASAQDKKMPKGGRKGGTRFPRIALKQALEYSKKLVSKTAVAPQPEATVLAGVFNNVGPEGQIRASALKQFQLMEGTAEAYKATQLARDIDGAADELERQPLIRRAMLSSKIFTDLFQTYHGDQASKGKIRGRALQLGVHPDFGDQCAELFMAAAETAGIGTRDGDGIRLEAATDGAPTPQPGADALPGQEPDPEEAQESNYPASVDGSESATTSAKTTASGEVNNASGSPTPRPRTAADVTLNLTVDSSLDGEKLAKQLALLRSYGLI